MSKISEFTIEKIKSLNMDQYSLFSEMEENNLLQVCIPTGAGKGYLMMVDLLSHISKKKENIFVVASHRLMLNSQHMNDIFSILSKMIGDIGYIFVGSSKFDVGKLFENPEITKSLFKRKIAPHEIISITTSTKEVDEMVKNHIKSNRKVVIFTTYHSMGTLKNLNIDTLYCDEAQTLATDADQSLFKDNFETLKYKRCYFFTATPKDCVDDKSDSFLMNNEKIFGKRTGLTFKYCVDKAYIVKPTIHIAIPSNLSYDVDFKSIKNMAKFVVETFSAHTSFIEQNSIDPSKIAPKILVKCPGVKEMWEIYDELVGKVESVKICAGASKDHLGYCHFIDNVGINDRNEYLEGLQLLKDNEKAIILHYDTMSEGVNVQGFTGVEFLGGKLPTITKTLQNTGRATRLHREDRRRVESGEIDTTDYSNWIKPFCSVIIPYWDKESQFTANELARQIVDLRDNFGYDPTFYVSIGSDIGTGKKEDNLEQLNVKDEKNKKTEMIDKIYHEIEQIDKAKLALIQKSKYDNMSMEEWFNFANK